ncbi:hypothetical protein JNUCC0626_40030 [Lentzea sp. JNUCC 0626]|uniref:hypothetical protein n=1 Tax=Lentzea sp. JNUCC 0626 TaxID=3367513 RepID=UPI003747F8A7
MTWHPETTLTEKLAVAFDLTLDPEFSITEIHAVEEFFERPPNPLAELGDELSASVLRGRRVA